MAGDQIEQFYLSGTVPTIRSTESRADIEATFPEFERQISSWGFLAFEVPGVGKQVSEMYGFFREACSSTCPSIETFSYDRIPQWLAGGNHGFFPYGSEIPRLSGGIPDPKEFLHVSGAMLENLPPGSGDLLEAFPALAASARTTFKIGFEIAGTLAEFFRSRISSEAPDLGLSRRSTSLRIVRYRDTSQREVLAHEHSGIQMLGIQLPPSDGGLQYVLNDGTWVEPVLASTDVLLCNVGRMLSKASGNRLRPSTHRVHRSASQGYERYSCVLFVHPDHALAQWEVDDSGNCQLNSGHTWGDFVRERVSGLGLVTKSSTRPS